MLKNLANKKTRYLVPLLQIMGVVQLVATLAATSLLISLGASEIAWTAIVSFLFASIQTFLAFFAARAIRHPDPDLGFILTIALALVALPSLLFVISFAIFWCLLPDELTENCKALFKKHLSSSGAPNGATDNAPSQQQQVTPSSLGAATAAATVTEAVATTATKPEPSPAT
jgi:hypothetical protein